MAVKMHKFWCKTIPKILVSKMQKFCCKKNSVKKLDPENWNQIFGQL